MLRSLTARRIVSQALSNNRSSIVSQKPLSLRFSTSSATMSVKQITSYEQFKEILKSDKVIALDAFAEWCGPCKMISPLYKKFATEAPADKIEFYEFDVDAQEQIAQELGISAMPTFTFFKGGQKVHQVVGANPQKLQAAIQDHCS